MWSSRRLTLALTIFIVSFFVAGHKSTLAASKPTGITVSPAFQQVVVKADEPEQPVSFSVTNDRTVPQTITLSAADFNTLNESGGLFFVGTNPTALQKKYGLAKWFSVAEPTITIAAKQTEIIHAKILNLPTLSGGGHYGALMIKLANPSDGLATNNNVAVDPIASSLMFVTKIGSDTHNLSLANVNFQHSLSKLPTTVTLKFQNTGNSHVVPRGIVKLQSPSGKIISQGIINEKSNIILPQSGRVYDVPLRQISTSTKPGKYKIFVDFRFDGIDQPRGYQASFWYIQAIWIIVPAVGLIALAGGGICVVRRLKTNK